MQQHQPSARRRAAALRRGLAALAGIVACGGAGLAASPAAQAATSTPAQLNGVSTVSATDAWAVGNSSNSSGGLPSLILRWNGTSWKKVSSPNPGGTTGVTYLAAVSADSATDAWAVGTIAATTSENPSRSLILHWNGTSWTKVSSPNPGGTAGINFLFGVSAISPTDAWAVGFYRTANSTRGKSLVLHWNGTTWAKVASPSPGGAAGNTGLLGVSAHSATNAWAVGYDQTSPGSSAQSLTLHWNGTSWKQVTSPSGTAGSTLLYGVSAGSATNAWATGYYQAQSVILHWNGASWTQVASPDPDPGANDLYSVSADSATDAWAVGTLGAGQSLAARWNGTSWSQVTSPSPGGSSGDTTLNGVSAVSATDAWAVGYYQTAGGAPDSPLILRWNGTSWTQVTSPS